MQMTQTARNEHEPEHINREARKMDEDKYTTILKEPVRGWRRHETAGRRFKFPLDNHINTRIELHWDGLDQSTFKCEKVWTISPSQKMWQEKSEFLQLFYNSSKEAEYKCTLQFSDFYLRPYFSSVSLFHTTLCLCICYNPNKLH